MTPNHSDWTAFDPSSGTLPDTLSADTAPRAGLVTVLADRSVDRSWSAEAVVALARGWASGGRKVFLADLHFEEPVLDGALGVENGEGISDVFVFGASVRHVARPVPDGGFLLATAGTAVGDPAAVLRHERWSAVLEGFREAGALLIAFVPSGTPGMDGLLGHSDEVVHLSEPDAPALQMEGGILARLGPEPSAAAVPETPAAPQAPSTETAPPLSEPSISEPPEAEAPEPEPPEDLEAPMTEPEPPENVEVPVTEPEPPEDVEAPVTEPEASEDLEAATEEAAGDFDLDTTAEAEAPTGEESGDFDLGELPSAEETTPADEDTGDGDLFSMDDLEGSQYVAGEDGTEDESGSEEMTLATEESGGGDEPEEGGDEPEEEAGGFDLGDEPLEVEEPEDEADEEPFEAPAAEEAAPTESQDVPEESEAVPEEDEGMPGLEVEGSALVDEDDLDDVAASSTMMEGLETGAGFEMPDDDSGAEDDTDTGDMEHTDDFGGGELEVEEPETEAETDEESDDFDFGDAPLEMEDEPDEPDPAEIEEEEQEEDLMVTSAADEMMASEPEESSEDNEEAPFLDPGAAEGGETPSPPTSEEDEAEPGSAEEGATEEGAGEEGAGEEGDGEEDRPPSDEGEMRVTTERKLSGLAKLEKVQKRKARLRSLAIAVVALLILGGGGFGLVYMGVVPIEGITPPDRMGASGIRPAELPGPVPTTPVMSHALVTRLYNDIESPWTLAQSARENLSDALFYVSPVLDGERLRWGLLVGPAYSAVEAEELREPVDAALAGGRFDETAWRVVDATYALFFGEYTSLGEAQSRVDGLLGQEVPTYVLQVDYSDSAGYRVYGGAYGVPAQAAPFLEFLQEREITDIPLIERRGKPPE